MTLSTHLLTAALLAPAALVAAADTAVPLSPTARQELDALEQDLSRVRQDFLADEEAEWKREMAAQADACLELLARFRQGAAVDASTQPVPMEPSGNSLDLGLTLLHLACIGQKPELVRELLAAGADPNHPSDARLFLAHADECLSMVVENGFPPGRTRTWPRSKPCWMRWSQRGRT